MIHDYLQKLLKISSERTAQSDQNGEQLTYNIVEMVKQRISDTLADMEKKDNDPSQNSFQEINRYIDLALKTFQNVSQPLLETEQQAQIIMVLSETYKTLGNYDAAEANFIEARKLARSEKNLTLEGQICYKLADLYTEMGKWVKADSLLKKSIKILASIDDTKGIAIAKLELAKRAYRKGEYSLAKDHFQAASQNADRAYDINQIATINNHLGLLYRIEGNYSKASEYFQKALLEYQGIQNQRGTAEAFNNLGVLYFKQGEMPEAVNYFDKALQICQKHGYSPTMAFVYLNKAEFYTKVGDYPMAVTNCGHAMEIMVYLKSPVGIAKSSNLLGRVFWEIGELDKADHFFRESIGFYRDFDIPLGYVNCSLEYAQFLSETDKPEAAKKILEQINNSVTLPSHTNNQKEHKNKYPYTVEITPFIKQTYNRRQLLEDVNDENILGDRIE
jgi:tetratricopeptide (TPR) repeat protein